MDDHEREVETHRRVFRTNEEPREEPGTEESRADDDDDDGVEAHMLRQPPTPL